MTAVFCRCLLRERPAAPCFAYAYFPRCGEIEYRKGEGSHTGEQQADKQHVRQRNHKTGDCKDLQGAYTQKNAAGCKDPRPEEHCPGNFPGSGTLR